jgi:uncharacterized protein (TIGR03086 family)
MAGECRPGAGTLQGNVDMNRLHRRAGEIFNSVLRRADGADWHAPTPCGEWNVRDLVDHVVSGNLWVPPLVAGQSLAEAGARLDGDLLGDDPIGVGLASTDAASAAFDEPGALERTVELSRGPSPARVYCAERMNDLTVHAWDLAAAIRVTVDLDDDCMSSATEYYRPQEAAGRPGGVFGPAVEVAPDAGSQTRFLAFWGRRADWTPEQVAKPGAS